MNPEFDRNLWLEAPPRRVLGAAVILALIYGATLLVAKDAPLGGTIAALGAAGMVVYVAAGVVWAGWSAGASILDEIRGRTWEFQRLSATSPWAMTWGKLFGAGSLAWLAAATGLVAVGVAAADRHGAGYALQLVLALVALTVFVQSCAMGAALIGVRKARAEGRPATGGAVVLGVIGGLILLSVFSRSTPLNAMHGLGVSPVSQFNGPDVAWWGLMIPAPTFVSLSLCAFAGWALAGAWRLMRLELQMRNAPWLWVGFLLFAAAWRAGLEPVESGTAGLAMAAALVFLAATYVCAFVEPADAVRLRRFWTSLRGGAWFEAALTAPAAVFAAKLAALAVIAYALSPRPDSLGVPVPNSLEALAVLAFMTRDLGVILLFRFGRRAGRGDLTAVIALALLYWAGGLIGGVAMGPVGVSLFAPINGQGGGAISLVSGAVQAVIAWTLAVQRLRGPKALAG